MMRRILVVGGANGIGSAIPLELAHRDDAIKTSVLKAGIVMNINCLLEE